MTDAGLAEQAAIRFIGRPAVPCHRCNQVTLGVSLVQGYAKGAQFVIE